MPPVDPTLPRDALLQVIDTLRATIEAQQRDLAAGRAEVARLVTMVEGLTKQLDRLLRDRDEERRQELARLREEAAKAAAAAGVGQPDEGTPGTEPGGAAPGPGSSSPSSRRSKHGRGQIPPELPRDTTSLAPERCARCGGDRLLAREKLVTEEYHYVRAHVRVRRTERTVCTCDDCDARVTPPQPPMPFDRAACTFEFMAWLSYARCALYLPLDRVRRDLESQGARIASATLTRWWKRAGDLLLPIAAAVRLSLLAQGHIRTDGTGLRVVHPRVKAAPKRGQERPGEVGSDGYLVPRPPQTGQILVFGDDSHAVYHFTPTKEGRHIQDFLTLGQDADGQPITWQGTITADAASVHDFLFDKLDCIESGCNAHGLRKFRDDADKAPLLASRAMACVGRVYDIEAEARAKEMKGADLLAWRRRHAGPVVAEFRSWIDDHKTDLLPSNPVRKAMQYYVNHWDALTRFLEDPDVPLDNNWSESALRKIALLRKNSLFAGGEDGAVRLCTIFTLVTTCRLLGVDAYDYLAWALQHVVPHPDNRGLGADDLTPAAYAAAHATA